MSIKRCTYAITVGRLCSWSSSADISCSSCLANSALLCIILHHHTGMPWRAGMHMKDSWLSVEKTLT